MASKNRLINGPVGERETPPPKPYQSFAYKADTGSPKIFTSREDYYAALSSGEWVDSPAKAGPKVEAPLSETKADEPSAVVQKASSPGKKYLSQMNVDELILEGFDSGLDFSDRSKTKAEMKTLIEAEKAKK